MIQQFILVIHLILAFSLIGLVLVQHGKGADAGAAFGSGASGTVFGSQGTGSFLTRLTTGIACFFAITSVLLTLFANQASKPETLSDKLLKQQQQSDLIIPAPVDPNAAAQVQDELPTAPPATQENNQN